MSRAAKTESNAGLHVVGTISDGTLGRNWIATGDASAPCVLTQRARCCLGSVHLRRANCRAEPMCAVILLQFNSKRRCCTTPALVHHTSRCFTDGVLRVVPILATENRLMCSKTGPCQAAHWYYDGFSVAV